MIGLNERKQLTNILFEKVRTNPCFGGEKISFERKKDTYSPVLSRIESPKTRSFAG
jgi:hypothetical protein